MPVSIQVCSALHQRYPDFAAELTSKLFSIFSPAAALGDYPNRNPKREPAYSAITHLCMNFAYVLSALPASVSSACWSVLRSNGVLQMRRRQTWLAGGPPFACYVSYIVWDCIMSALPYWTSSGQTFLCARAQSCIGLASPGKWHVSVTIPHVAGCTQVSKQRSCCLCTSPSLYRMCAAVCSNSMLAVWLFAHCKAA